MFSFGLGALLRFRKKKSGVRSDVEDLIRLHGVNAYNEARRQRSEAEDLATARYWAEVKSEIGRRIVETCGHQAILDSLGSKPFDAVGPGVETSDPAFEKREPTSRPSGSANISNLDARRQETSGAGVDTKFAGARR